MGGITWDLADVLQRSGRVRPVANISTSLEGFERFASASFAVLPVRTFASAAGALFGLPRVLTIRRALAGTLRRDGTKVAITIIAHLWGPFVADLWRRFGVFHAVVVHDADPHPGDPTAPVQRWLLAQAMRADAVITLSEHVALQIERSGKIPAERIIRLFLPDLTSGAALRMSGGPRPLRFLFFGRIASYKGLPLFAAAVSLLRREGHVFEAAVIGDGDLGESRGALEKASVEIDNRWISEAEIAGILERFDVMVASHTEASQSGVVSLALGAGMPSIVTPVGALVHQIDPGVTGLAASEVSAEAIAAAMRELIENPALVERLADGVAATAAGRSFDVFADRLLTELDRVMALPARQTA